MKTILILIISGLFVTACSNVFEEKSISEFTIDNDALVDGELVEVVYAMKPPDYNKDLNYYIKMIVVSVNTKDTVNLLTTSMFDVSEDNRIKNFISSESDTYKVMQALQMKQDIENLDEIKSKKITKVLVHKKFKELKENNYPTVIGILGEITDIE